MVNSYRISGVVKCVERLGDYSSVTISPQEPETNEVRIIFFGALNGRYTERVVDFEEIRNPNGSLIQKLEGADFSECAEVSKEQVREFGEREDFIPRIQVSLAI